MFFNTPPVELDMFFNTPPVELVALPCALAALTAYRVTIVIAINSIAFVIANDVCLCIKSCSKDNNIKILSKEALVKVPFKISPK
jgi:hypothetical protein